MRFAVVCRGASIGRGSRDIGTTTPTAAASPPGRGIATAAQLTPSIESLSSMATVRPRSVPVCPQIPQAPVRPAHDGWAVDLGR